jgi:hypothetical protein
MNYQAEETHRTYRKLNTETNLTTTHEPRHSRKNKTNDNSAYMQPYSIVASDAVLDFGTAVITDVLSLDKHLS